MNLPPFKLERFFAKYEFNTEFLLCSSDCEAMSIADLLAMEPGAAEKFQQVWLGYTESQGSPALRKEICKLYETIQPEDILVHTGAEEAIFIFMFDHVPKRMIMSSSIRLDINRWQKLPAPQAVMSVPGGHVKKITGRSIWMNSVTSCEAIPKPSSSTRRITRRAI